MDPNDPVFKTCWYCKHRDRSAGFERFRCLKRMVWTVGFFNGVKDYEMGALKVKGHSCRKFLPDFEAIRAQGGNVGHKISA